MCLDFAKKHLCTFSSSLTSTMYFIFVMGGGLPKSNLCNGQALDKSQSSHTTAALPLARLPFSFCGLL